MCGTPQRSTRISAGALIPTTRTVAAIEMLGLTRITFYTALNAAILRTGALMIAGSLISAFAALWRVRGLVHPNGFANMH